MDTHLSDGEIISDNEDMISRPTECQADSIKKVYGFQRVSTSSARPYRTTKLSDDDDSEKSDGELFDDDNDDDDPHQASSMRRDACGVTTQSSKSKHSVWSKVLLEQSLTQGFSDVGVKKQTKKTRGVESYDHTQALLDTRPPLPNEGETFESDTPQAGGPAVPASRKRRFGCVATSSPTEVDDQTTGTDASHSMEVEVKRPMSERLGSFARRGEGRRDVGCTEADTATKVAQCIVLALREEKPELIDRVVNFLGVPRSLDLLHETLDVEEAGGILTLDSSRRRTPGGVFLYLLRQDASIEEAKKTAIFEESRREYAVKLREMKRRSRQQKQKHRRHGARPGAAAAARPRGKGAVKSAAAGRPPGEDVCDTPCNSPAEVSEDNEKEWTSEEEPAAPPADDPSDQPRRPPSRKWTSKDVEMVAKRYRKLRKKHRKSKRSKSRPSRNVDARFAEAENAADRSLSEDRSDLSDADGGSDAAEDTKDFQAELERYQAARGKLEERKRRRAPSAEAEAMDEATSTPSLATQQKMKFVDHDAADVDGSLATAPNSRALPSNRPSDPRALRSNRPPETESDVFADILQPIEDEDLFA